MTEASSLHSHQEHTSELQSDVCSSDQSRPDACTVLVKYSLACELNCFSTWSWWDCVVIALSFCCLSIKGQRQTLVCPVADLTYLIYQACRD